MFKKFRILNIALIIVIAIFLFASRQHHTSNSALTAHKTTQSE